MLKIKLARTGSRNRPAYRVVVAEERSKLTGDPVEYLGYYHPMEKKLDLDKEAIKKWIGKGAEPTPQMAKLLKRK